MRDTRRGMVEVYMHWHTSLKLFKVAAEHDDVAHLTEDGRVEYAGGEVVKAPKRPTGHAPEQLVVAVLKVTGLSCLAAETAVRVRVEVDDASRESAPRLVAKDAAYFQERFHFDVEAWEGAGYWDGPPVTLSLVNARDASAAPDWAMPVAAKTLRTPTLTLRERRTIDLGRGLALDVFLWWRHLEDPHLFKRPKPPVALRDAAPAAAAPAPARRAAGGKGGGDDGGGFFGWLAAWWASVAVKLGWKESDPSAKYASAVPGTGGGGQTTTMCAVQ